MDFNETIKNMLAAAAKAAGSAWADIKTVATHEFEVLAQRIFAIDSAISSGQMSQTVAKSLFNTARSQLVAVLAMLSTMMAAAANKIVSAALDVVKGAINTAIGFKLII